MTIPEALSRSWAAGKIEHIAPFLPPPGSTILDIGSGTGMVTTMLRQQGYMVEPLDVRDRSLARDGKPTLYDGVRIPCADDQFDTALLLTVLHHTPDPDAVLREARRVAAEVIVVEDVFGNPLQKYLTFFTDSLFNMEFTGHPHSNRTDHDWRRTFPRLRLNLRAARCRPVLLLYRQCAYHLVRDAAS